MKDFKTTALAATALCAILSACGTTPLYPTTAPAQPAQPTPAPTPAPTPPPPADNGITAAPTTPVEASALPPPPGAREAPARPPCREPVYTPPPPRMIAQKAPGSGKVHTETPEPITVKKGDTLVAISHRTKIYVADLAKENDLKKPYRLKLGSQIKLPATRYYEVESGDTLYSIAHRFGLEPKALAEFSKLSEEKGVRGGEKIYLPDDAKDKGAPKPIMVEGPRPRPQRIAPVCPPVESEAPPAQPQAYTPPPSPPSPAPYTPPAAPAPYTPSPPAAPVSRPPAVAPSAQPAPATTSTDSDVAAAGRGLFQWPVRGELITTFGQKGAVRSDGIDIGATRGDSVRAAADGEVVYAGSAVQGFGNLVLIKHPGGWVTAYAHLASIEVKMRQTVTQGQEVGLVGDTGGVDRPQLHFEIRYAPTPKDKARPIDPMLVLPVQ